MTPFDHLIGNASVKGFLGTLAQRKKIPNSLLFLGKEGVGKSLFAEAFAKKVLGTTRAHHPDIFHFRPEGKTGMHAIGAIRRFIEEVSLAPFEGRYKLFIIHDAHRMLPTSANALLKTFEEPAEDSIIILLSNAKERLLPTILSRCQTIRFAPVAEQEMQQFLQEHHQVGEVEAEVLACRSEGSIAEALRLLENPSDPLEESLMRYLASDTFGSYQAILDVSSEVGELVEGELKEEGDLLREELLKEFGEAITALQREAIDKEVDGVVTMKKLAKVERLFTLLLSWYRDLHLLKIENAERYLIHFDRKEALEASGKRPFPSLKAVTQVLERARLGVERSIGIPLVFETLFLSIV